MLRPRPRSTLFPYTTLFRSRRCRRRRCRRPHCRRFLPCRRRRDRKSTRLNSSHVATSYAVFCLKKKRDVLCALHIEITILVDSFHIAEVCPCHLPYALPRVP